eukprot:6187653-Pleurochrysis_carterae.AAC.4
MATIVDVCPVRAAERASAAHSLKQPPLLLDAAVVQAVDVRDETSRRHGACCVAFTSCMISYE